MGIIGDIFNIGNMFSKSYWRGQQGKGTDWERKQFKAQQEWAERDWERSQQWRDEDIQRNSLQSRMQEHREAGLHPSLAAGGFGGTPLAGGSGATGASPSARGAPTGGEEGSETFMLGLADIARQTKLDRATIEKERANARLLDAQAEDVEWSTDESRTERHNAEIESLLAGAAQARSQSELNEKQTGLLEHEIERYMHDNNIIFDSRMVSNPSVFGGIVRDIVGVTGIAVEEVEKFIRNLVKSRERTKERRTRERNEHMERRNATWHPHITEDMLH